MSTTFQSLLLSQSVLCLFTQSTDVVSPDNAVYCGRAVYCLNLPKQSTADLERRASVMRNSFCEILDPPIDDAVKVRLRWLGDEQTCGAVRPRYLQIVPLVYIHYIEDHDGSQQDIDRTREFFTALAAKLRKDDTQTVTEELLHSHSDLLKHHVLTTLSFADFRKTCHGQEVNLFPDGVVQRVIDRKLVPIPHRIHGQMNDVFRAKEYMTGIAHDASSNPIQSYFPLQRPALRIHLFADELALIQHGSELYDEIMDSPKQIAAMAASEAEYMTRWRFYWALDKHRITQSSAGNWRLFVAHSNILSDPDVLNDKRRLSNVVQTLLRIVEDQQLIWFLDKLKNVSGGRPVAFRKMIGKMKKLIALMRDESYRLYAPWNNDEARILTFEEKSKRLDKFLKEWEIIVMVELGLKKSEMRQILKHFGMAVQKFEREHPSAGIERGTASDQLVLWTACDFWLDPSYTVNILLLQGPDLSQRLLKKTCVELGFSWKALLPNIQWIDYEATPVEPSV